MAPSPKSEVSREAPTILLSVEERGAAGRGASHKRRMVQPQLIRCVIRSHHPLLQPDPGRAQDCSHWANVKPVTQRCITECLLENIPVGSRFSRRPLPPWASGPARERKGRVIICQTLVKMIASKTLLGNHNPMVFSGFLREKVDGDVIPGNAIPSDAWKRRKTLSKLTPQSRRKIRPT